MINEEYFIVRDEETTSGMIWSSQSSGFVLLSQKLQSPFKFPTKDVAIAAAKKYRKRHDVPLQIVQCFVIPQIVATVCGR